MKKNILTIAAVCVGATVFAAGIKNPPTTPASEQTDAQYTRVIDLRSQKIVDALGLSDANTAAKVHGIIMAQYRALNSWHNANDPRIKAAKGNRAAIAKINEPLKKMHAEYLARLARYLTPAQIETVKDKMTYNKVQFTFKGYCVEYPNLSDANKQAVLQFLKQAREKAMDAGSSEEKSAIFNQYKGKINNYLSKEGVHSKRWMVQHSQTNSPSK